MKRRILVSGLLNVETTVAVRDFPIPYYPIDYPFFGVNSHVSGVGFNLAKALTVLGDQVELVSFLGQDEEGRRVRQELEEAGIPTGRIIPSLRNTPASVILFAPDGRRQVYCDLKDIQEQTVSPESVGDILKRADLAVLCNINFNRELIRYARREGIPTATDVHVLSNIEDEYNRDFMENADILFLSDEKLPGAPEDFLHQVVERFRNRIIVIGMGAKGALLWEEAAGRITSVPAYSTGKIVNTVGAGDALFSAFLHFYGKGLSPVDALQRAVVFAGIKIGSNGASLGFVSEELLEKTMKGC